MTTPADRHLGLIATLGLVAHPEGGYYSEVYRSPARVKPEDGREHRSALTTIYFLLPQGQVSRWHRVQSDEAWHFYEGAPLELWVTKDLRRIERHRLGPVEEGQQPAVVVPAGCWQAARPTTGYTLVGCTVGPGFDFEDFAMARDDPTVAAALRKAGAPVAELL